MAKIRVLKQKDKRYAFKALGNDVLKNPAAVIFKRFPQPAELFHTGISEILQDKLDIDITEFQNNKDESTKKLTNQMVDLIVNNLNAAKFNYRHFANECIEGFENFEFESENSESEKKGFLSSFFKKKKNNDLKIETVDDLFALPDEAIYKILDDCYFYSVQKDEFTMGE